MKITNSSERWGAITQLLHWSVVVLIITQFTIASIAEDLPLGMQKLAWLARHKSVGITILGIAIARFAWRLLSPGPSPPANLNPLERRLAVATHIGLYLALFLMPISGWLMSSAKGYPVSWFNLVQLPDLIVKNERVFEWFKQCHELLAAALVALAIVHVAGALKHHFVHKDNVLRRMLPCLATILLFATLGKSLPVESADLFSDSSDSKLTFSFTQAGGLNSGEFSRFDVVLSGAAAAEGELTVTIDTASLDTRDQDRDGILRGADLFDTTRFPRARFVATQIRSMGSERYVAAGTLTIRDVSRTLDLPFTLRDVTESATDETHMTGEVTIRRLDYGIGQGEWRSTQWIANEVSIAWSVRLVPGEPGKAAGPSGNPVATELSKPPGRT